MEPPSNPPQHPLISTGVAGGKIYIQFFLTKVSHLNSDFVTLAGMSTELLYKSGQLGLPAYTLVINMVHSTLHFRCYSFTEKTACCKKGCPGKLS